MKIELKQIAIRDVVRGYLDKGDEGVVGYGGKLDIRPAYQREFVYRDKQRDAVIDTVFMGFPLNVMYWAKTGPGTYEVLDGQQRTISICDFAIKAFSVSGPAGSIQYIDNIAEDLRERFLDYPLFVYVCEGNESEKLAWFRTINIAGEKLTDQELRNAVYPGPWLTDAKKRFSKKEGPAAAVGSKFMAGKPQRQEFLETAIDWASGGEIEAYMARSQHLANAGELWLHFKKVIDWAELLFGKYDRKELKGVDFGSLYKRFHDKFYDPDKLEAEVARLMADVDVSHKAGIYPYLFDRDPRHLNIRAFTPNQKREAYERQGHECPKCGPGLHYAIEEMEADHITPWHLGGKTTAENCQMLCKHHNRLKSGV